MTRPPPAPAPNFIRNIIEADLASGKYANRRWAGHPGVAAEHRIGPPDPAKIRTRFPPEPNGYLHIGHAKSICLNFGLAQQYGGRCHLRFDDTNPEKEEQEYVDSIIDAVKWLGFSWEYGEGDQKETCLYYASDYFDRMYEFAESLVLAGHAYVDSQTADEIRANRGTLTEVGRNSPFRDRHPHENLKLLQEMREGRHPDGAMVLRAKIDMTSPNMNMRDPVLYRIRYADHHRTGSKWCIYPMYDYAHPIEDALENITHSICTLEFEDHRPLYDWVLERLADLGHFDRPLPQQYEFNRLNLTHTVMSKRKLQELVRSGAVDGWDDPRMPTIAGLRRRGYTPESIRLFCDRIGVSKTDGWIEMSVLEQALRDDLEDKAPRVMVVLDPLKLKITNWPEGHVEECTAPFHPKHPEMGMRRFPISGELWIERDDFAEVPPKGFYRLYPGNMVRLRYGYVIRCTGCEKDAEGNVTAVLAEYMPDSKSGTAGADGYKVKGNVHWVAASSERAAEIDLFLSPPAAAASHPSDGRVPPEVRRVRAAAEATADTTANAASFQFERLGYFSAIDPGCGQPRLLRYRLAVRLRGD